MQLQKMADAYEKSSWKNSRKALYARGLPYFLD